MIISFAINSLFVVVSIVSGNSDTNHDLKLIGSNPNSTLPYVTAIGLISAYRRIQFECLGTLISKRSSRESYGDNAIQCIQVKRENHISTAPSTAKARLTSEHNLYKKNYNVYVQVNAQDKTVLEYKCCDCSASEDINHDLKLIGTNVPYPLPYVTAFGVNIFNRNLGFECLGTVITRRFIVTSGRCIEGKSNAQSENYMVAGNILELREDRIFRDPRPRRRPKKFYHLSSVSFADFGLISVQLPFNLTILRPLQIGTPVIHTPIKIFGFKHDRHNLHLNERKPLMEARVLIKSHFECSQLLQYMNETDHSFDYVPEMHFCSEHGPYAPSACSSLDDIGNGVISDDGEQLLGTITFCGRYINVYLNISYCRVAEHITSALHNDHLY